MITESSSPLVKILEDLIGRNFCVFGNRLTRILKTRIRIIELPDWSYVKSESTKSASAQIEMPQGRFASSVFELFCISNNPSNKSRLEKMCCGTAFAHKTTLVNNGNNIAMIMMKKASSLRRPILTRIANITAKINEYEMDWTT
jgi:hypothetical protein